MRYSTLRLSLVIVAALVSGASVGAQPAATTRPTPQIVRLTLHPMATTRPALRYKLLPDLVEQTQGNAATLYMAASERAPQAAPGINLLGDVEKILYAAPDQFSPQQAEQALVHFEIMLREAELAAHREQAQWDSDFRERGAGALLPFVNDVRGLEEIWALRARVQIARGDWPAAARTLQNGLTLARHLNQQAALVQGLVELGNTSLMLERLRDWVSRPDAPNLYWPLSDLPQPFIDLHTIEQWERATIYFTFPALREALDGPVAPQRWRQFIEQLPGLASRHGDREQRIMPATRVQAALLVAWAYPKARQYLESTGLRRDQIDAMDVDEVVGKYFLDDYRTIADEQWKAWGMPFRESHIQLRNFRAELAARHVPEGGLMDELQSGQSLSFEERQEYDNPLMAFVIPLEMVRFRIGLVDREIAVLRTIEAIRDYAARHEGQPPASLEDIKDLPLPIDPVLGTRFTYQRDGQVAVLGAEAPDPSFPISSYPTLPQAQRFELTVAK